MLRALDPRRVVSGGSDAAVGAFEDEARVRCGDDRVRREVVGDEGSQIGAVAAPEVDDEVLGARDIEVLRDVGVRLELFREAGGYARGPGRMRTETSASVR